MVKGHMVTIEANAKEPVAVILKELSKEKSKRKC